MILATRSDNIVTCTIVDDEGTAVDPDAIELWWKLSPTGREYLVPSGSMTHEGTGIYSYAINPPDDGQFDGKSTNVYYEFRITNPDTVTRGKFAVSTSVFGGSGSSQDFFNGPYIDLSGFMSLANKANDEEAEEGEVDTKWLSAEGGATLLQGFAFPLGNGYGSQQRSIKDRWKDWVRVNEEGTSTAAQNSMIAQAVSEGKKLIFPKRKGLEYPLTSTLGRTLGADESLHIVFEDAPLLRVQPGFAAGSKAVQFILNASARLRIDGDVIINVEDLPNSSPGQANDGFGINGDGTGRCYIDGGIEVYHGSGHGGDSSFFLGYLTEFYAKWLKGDGPPDAVLYGSGGSQTTDEVAKQHFLDALICKNAVAGVIYKRCFRDIQIGRISGEDVGTLVCFGDAAEVGAVNNTIEANLIKIGHVYGKRCGATVNLRYCSDVSVDSVQADQLGNDGAVTRVQAVLLQGAQRCKIGPVHANGKNPNLGALDFCGVFATNSSIGSEGTRNSTDNEIGPIYSTQISRSVREASTDQNRNTYLIGSEDISSANVILGAASRIFSRTEPLPNPKGLKSFPTTTIADDSVATFDLGGRSCIISVITNSNIAPSLNGTFKVATTASVTNIALASTTNVTFTTGTLAGTTGSDGNITIAIHTDNLLYIENRRGSGLQLTLSIIVMV